MLVVVAVDRFGGWDFWCLRGLLCWRGLWSVLVTFAFELLLATFALIACLIRLWLLTFWLVWLLTCCFVFAGGCSCMFSVVAAFRGGLG